MKYALASLLTLVSAYAQAPADFFQKEIADEMPQGVVDGFEAIEIEQYNRNPGLLGPRIGNSLL